ncbi:hypothetical protein [Actinoplanes xinjiangensis]|uniref:hypothetical protein n=1 Tax=Actinoplanes xinjiangensis TaxID=512350 RepID=UPI000D6BFAA5|nr:hypothetical protein [Actinoplanes xinjiangensis]GIF40339.1 hypothetical protein Axi01nite_46500 [Actinoplanes xinjiangensis]
MHDRRPVLLAAAASGAVAIVAALFGADQFAAQAGLLALGSLGVLVAARQQAVRRVRWSLFAGIAVLAVAVAVPDIFNPSVAGPQRLAPATAGTDTFVRDVVVSEWLTLLAVLLACTAFLWTAAGTTGPAAAKTGRAAAMTWTTAGTSGPAAAPIETAAVIPAPPEPVTAVGDSIPAETATAVADPMSAEPVAAVADPLSGETATSVVDPLDAEPAAPVGEVSDPAVTAHRRGDPVIVAAAAGALLIVVTVADLGLVTAGQKRSGAAGQLLIATGFPLAVALFAVTSAVLAAYRMTGRTVAASATVAAGGLLLAVSALAVVYMGVLSAPLPYGYARNLIFDAAMVRTGWGDLDLLAALKVAGMLAGAGCLVHSRTR